MGRLHRRRSSSSAKQSPYYEADSISPNFAHAKRWLGVHTTNKHHTVLYTGITSNLPARINEHLIKHYPFSFIAKYNADKLVYYKLYDTIEEAITEEKGIKGGNRLAKMTLVESMNPKWINLWLEDVCKW